MGLSRLRAQTCCVVTHGRRTGAEHVVRVWFAIAGTRFYAASRHGWQGDWLKNALHQGSLEVRVAGGSWRGPVSLVTGDEIPHVLDAFADKYRKHPDVIAAWRQRPPVFLRADIG